MTSIKKPLYSGFGEAPDDNPEDLGVFAAKIRKGQPKFRKNLLLLYNSRCAITGDGPDVVLEAAHIVCHAVSGLNHSSNGLLLRADLHSLMDADLLRIDPEDFSIILDPELERTSYWQLAGCKLRERVDGSIPSVDLIEERWPVDNKT